MRDVRERINLLEQDQRRSAEVVRELQSQSQAATVAQLTEDVSSLRKQLALANRESQRRAEQDRERLDAMADQLQAVCEDALQNRADHERTKSSLVELVEKIAQQFDAHDTHLRSLLESMESMRGEQAAALAEIRRDAEAIREEQRQTTVETSRAFDNALESIRGTETSLASMSARVDGDMEALEAQLGSKTDEMVAKFAEYQKYVGRLRKELTVMHAEFQGSRDTLVREVTCELDGADAHMNELREHFGGGGARGSVGGAVQ